MRKKCPIFARKPGIFEGRGEGRAGVFQRAQRHVQIQLKTIALLYKEDYEN